MRFPSLQTLLPADDRWRYAFLGVVLSVPVALVFEGVSTDAALAGPIVYAGFVAGYLCDSGTVKPQTTGARAGFLGSLPLLAVAVHHAVTELGYGFSEPVVTSALEGVTLGVFVALVFAMAGVLGTLGAVFGSWLARQTRWLRALVAGS